MKRTICLLLIALMGLGILAGCQKTPDTPLTIGKYETLLAAEQAAASDPAAIDAPAGVDLYERLGAPEVYAAQLRSEKGQLTVDVNAVVSLPDSDMPIIRVNTADFTMEQVKAYADVFFGSNPVYTDGTNTKGYCQREVDKLKRAIENWDSYGNIMYDLRYYTLEEAKKGLQELEETAAQAPSIPPAVTPDFTWQKPRVWTDEGEVESTDVYIRLHAMPSDSVISELYANTHRQFGNSASLYYIRDNFIQLFGVDHNKADISGRIATTEQEAQTLAADLIKRLELDDFVCSGSQTNSIYDYYKNYPDTIPMYSFYFTRSIDGIPETLTNDTVSSMDGTENSWSYEQICVKVDDEGIAFFRYDNPMRLGETVAKSATLMPFSDIRGIFEKMILIVGNHVDTGVWGESTEQYHVTDVHLGMMSVRDNANNQGLLIPVWDFLGYTTTFDAATGRTYDTDTNGYRSFLTINAIDGTIMQRGYGE